MKMHVSVNESRYEYSAIHITDFRSGGILPNQFAIDDNISWLANLVSIEDTNVRNSNFTNGESR